MPEEREDVEATLQQDTAPDTSQQKRKWRSIDWIAGSTLVAEALLSIIWVIAWAFGYRFEHQLQVYLALVLFILTGGYLALIFCPIFKKNDDPRWFHARILSSGILGGSYAFLLPLVLGMAEGSAASLGTSNGYAGSSASALRQAILFATGGLIAITALGETRRKNEQEKLQHNENTLKDRRAERRERYFRAIEQLASTEATIRMGGVYTLVGLIDEWLEEKSLKREDRIKEGQVIIHNLCAYIRSPFDLASQYKELSYDIPSGIYQDNSKHELFYKNRNIFKSEQDVRLTIIKEIHDRLYKPSENTLYKSTPGSWSIFSYNFSGSTFFYPIDFSKSHYKKFVIFSNSRYYSQANFYDCHYYENTEFWGSTYHDSAYFGNCIYHNKDSWVNFNSSTYYGYATFAKSIYSCISSFDGSTYCSLHTSLGSIYHKRASFSNSVYTYTSDNSDSIYNDKVNFNDSIYHEPVYYNSKYNSDSDFSGSVFYGSIIFNKKPSSSEFSNKVPIFYNIESQRNSLFNSRENEFSTKNYKINPIDLNTEKIPYECLLLTYDQNKYIKNTFQEIIYEKDNMHTSQQPQERQECLRKIQSLAEELRNWRDEVTTVKLKVEDVAAEDTKS